MTPMMAKTPTDELVTRMSAAAQVPTQMAPVNPHDTLTMPLGPPRMSANELGDPMGRSNELGDSLPEQAEAPPETPKMSPLASQREHINKNLMADYQKDADPYGSPNNHPGIFGKILHGLNVATGGVNRRQWEEEGLEKRIQDISKEESTQGLQGAQTEEAGARTAGLVQDNANAPQKSADAHAASVAGTANIRSETQNRDNPAPNLQHFATDDGFYSFDPRTNKVTPLSYNGQPVKPEQKLEYQTTVGADGKPHTFGLDSKGQKVVDEGEHYEKPNTTNINAGTWSLQNDTEGNPILFNSKTGKTEAAPGNLARKPNAEELKRADLAENVNENLTKLEDIATRRPELFGPIAGRMTKGKEMMGTSDPDIAALKTLEDNLGMALQSAHGMRSAQHVETSAQSVLNGLKNSPEALRAAIKIARQSVSTFQHDVSNTNEAGKPSGQPQTGMVENGYRFKGGNPSDAKNWERVQ